VKECGADLNATLIFVRPAHRLDAGVLTWTRQAGLFSAVTSAFIIQIQSELWPDPNEETAALLRVLIHKTDNTTFGGNVPTVPQWSGPPRSIVQVQAMLYASFAATLLSALLAMLGWQCLDRYESTDVRGSAVDRSQNRQRKLNGIVTWYFGHVMGSFVLASQAALLLFGCALSRYLWEINITIACIVIGFTSAGVILYGFVCVVGAAFEGCPYQTPGSRVLRSAASAAPQAFKYAIQHSTTVRLFRKHVAPHLPPRPRPIHRLVCSLMAVFCGLPVMLVMLAVEVFCLGRAMVQPLVTPAPPARQAYPRLLRAPSTPTHGLDHQKTLLDLQCISWTLHTSQDPPIRLLTLKYLATMVELDDLDPTIVTACFDIFIGCVKFADGAAIITQELKELATVSATCLLYTILYISVMDPLSSVLGDVRHRYRTNPKPLTNICGLPFPYTFHAIRGACYPDQDEQWLDLGDYKPSSDEHVVTGHALAKFAWSESQSVENLERKVPGWILHFAFHSLSMDPPPSTPVVVNCLSVIAIDLGCDVSTIGTTDERYVLTRSMSISLTQKQWPNV